MNKQEKAEIISEIVNEINNSAAVYVVNYSGINVEDISKIRNEFRQKGIRYKVYKNTLFKRALDESGKYTLLGNNLAGMSGYAFADSSDPVAPAKIIQKYNEDTSKLSLKGCYIENSFFHGSQLKELASLPNKAEIIAGILGSLNSPISGVVGAINAVMRDLVSVVDQISKREAA